MKLYDDMIVTGKRIIAKSYAKINLSLDVLKRLDNGYHEVKMVMQSISLYDKVNIKKNDSGTINVKTNLSYLPVNGDNLVYKAASIMKEKLKNIPGITGYIVKEGDTLWNIAKRFYTTADSIMEANNLENDMIYPGMKLIILKLYCF